MLASLIHTRKDLVNASVSKLLSLLLREPSIAVTKAEVVNTFEHIFIMSDEDLDLAKDQSTYQKRIDPILLYKCIKAHKEKQK